MKCKIIWSCLIWPDFVYECSLRPGMEFKKVGRTALNRDSSIHLHPMPMPNFWEAILWHKSWAYGGIGRKPFYEINPWEISFFPYLDCPSSQTASYHVVARKSLLVRAHACNAKTWCRHMQLMCIVFGYYLYTLFQEIFVIVNLYDIFWHLRVHILTMSGQRNKL